MKNNLNILCILSVSGFLSAQQTDTENYIYTKNCLDADCIKKTEAVQYFDGLGRPKQSIAVKASPEGKDVVSHIEYDRYSRVSKSYLPVPQTETRNGGIYENPLANASDPGIYGNEKIYSEQIIENSPLERVTQSFGIGNAWSGKPVNFNYSTNSAADGVKKYPLTTSWAEGRSNSVPGIPVAFAPNTLMKTSVTDEDGNTVTEFKNGKGQPLLVRKNDGSVNSDTYYIYDQYGRLAYVIPPLASVSSSLDQAALDNLCYQYRYDGLGRLVEKKLPGKGWEEMVYDKADRLILSRDANLKKDGKWMITKYDQLGRVLYTGMISAGERPALQDLIKNLTITESRNTGGFTKNGLTIYYTNDYFTVDITTVLSINYYDSYPQGAPAVPGRMQNQDVLQETGGAVSTMGLPLASYVKNIEDDNWTRSYMYYDTKGRSIGSYSVNHLGGFTRMESQLDFAGMIKKTVTKHKRLDTDPEKMITENFTYDDQGRLLIHKHQVDNGPEEILAQNIYNKLSQLETKKVGGTDLASPLQTIDYKYNIRGWLTKINDPANLNGKLFGYEMKYQNPVYNTKSPGRYNGNITEIDWKNASENVLKRYTYAYDGLNQLKDAFYAEPEATNPHNGNYDEYLTYDLNGNIKTLKRKAFPIGGATSTLVDDLDYIYTGNRLSQVIENSMNDTGYEGGNNTISYDLNGSMTNLKDKGIYSIAYNYLDLPDDLSISQNGPNGVVNDYNINYLYRADGTKLRKIYSYIGSRVSPGNVRKTDYLDGFQYSYFEGGISCPVCRTESAFEEKAYKEIEFPGTGTPVWTLDFVPTSEGFYSFTENRYIYQYRDHLGNARISFAQNSTGSIDITDTNNYYPFGLNHIDGQISKGQFGSYQSYKYNGKELQETGMFDYGARMYMPDLGRWGVMDALSEKGYDFSPYNYAINNPIRFVDPDGNQIYINDGQNMYRYANGHTEWMNPDTKSWVNVKDAGVELSAFATSIVTALFMIENGGKSGNSLIGFFEGKQNDIKIEQTKASNYYENGVAYINPTSNPKLFTVNGLESTSTFITLAHEMAHGMDPQKKPDLFGPWFDPRPIGERGQGKCDVCISNSEKFASHIENQIRAEWGMSLRASYATVNGLELDPRTMLVDKFGNSTYFDNRNQQLSGINGDDKINAYQSIKFNKNTPLIKRYNYYERNKQGLQNISLRIFLIRIALLK